MSFACELISPSDMPVRQGLASSSLPESETNSERFRALSEEAHW